MIAGASPPTLIEFRARISIVAGRAGGLELTEFRAAITRGGIRIVALLPGFEAPVAADREGRADICAGEKHAIIRVQNVGCEVGHQAEEILGGPGRVLIGEQGDKTGDVGRRCRSPAKIRHTPPDRRGAGPPIGRQDIEVGAAVRVTDELIRGGRRVDTKGRATGCPITPTRRAYVRIVNAAHRNCFGYTSGEANAPVIAIIPRRSDHGDIQLNQVLDRIGCHRTAAGIGGRIRVLNPVRNTQVHRTNIIGRVIADDPVEGRIHV